MLKVVWERVAKKVNTSVKKDKIDWDRVREVIGLIKRAGGEVINQHPLPRSFTLPKKPGIKLLGYGDCLIQAGFKRRYSEDEEKALLGLRGTWV
jgi:hypothetical protein